MATLHQMLIDTGLFREAPGRYLVHEQPFDGEMLIGMTVMKFDCFGDLVDIESLAVEAGMREIVAQNRKALGLPPQEK